MYPLFLFLFVFLCISFMSSTDSLLLKAPPSTRLTVPLSALRSPRDHASAALDRTLRVASGLTVGLLLGANSAISAGISEANQKLSDYGFPPILFVPPGFTPLVSEYGRGNARTKMSSPVLVQFCHPSNWIQTTTTVNKNGEAGTVSANDYMKGDSAFLFVSPSADSELSMDKAVVRKLLLKSLSQKGDPVDDLVVRAISETTQNGQRYVIAQLSYSLNTEAGFIIGRKGFSAMTSIGGNIQSLVAVTTDLRFGKLAKDLEAVVDSFRVYRLNSGLFAAENA